MPSPELLQAQALVQRGQFADAERLLAGFQEVGEDGLIAGIGLAGIYLRSSRFDQASQKLAGLIAGYGERPDLVAMLLSALQSLGDWKSVIFWTTRLLERNPRDPGLIIQQGRALLELGDPVSAGAAFRHAIELDRQSPVGYFFLGKALKLGGKSFEAFETFRRVIELDSKIGEAYIELWLQMRQILNWADGLPYLESGLRQLPQSAPIMGALAETYAKVGRLEEAEQLFQKAVAKDANLIAAYAHHMHEQGRFAESIPWLEKSVKLTPFQGIAYYLLSIAKAKEVGGRPLRDVAAEIQAAGKVTGEEAMFLDYCLAKTTEASGDLAHAMEHYDSANSRAASLFHTPVIPADGDGQEELELLRSLYSTEAIERMGEWGSSSDAPIFIVGMIRTGTTLLDTILASHPDVRSAGEQPYWQIVSGRTNRKWLERGATAAEVGELVSGYRKVLATAAVGTPNVRVSDKMPTNFAHIGLMSACFPKAKFIHMRRNPMDTVISIYTTFLGRGTQFAYDQQRIVNYYLEYLDYMEMWRELLPPGRMIEVDYETLVSEKEPTLRAIIDFCELPWNDAVLHHEDQQRQVSTPSLWTVRQSVNTGSVGRWKRYEPYLRELLQLRDVQHPAPVNS